MSSCLLVQRTSKHLGHNSSAQAILSVLSSLSKGQVELQVGQRKEKTLLPTGQVHLNLLLLPCKAHRVLTGHNVMSTVNISDST